MPSVAVIQTAFIGDVVLATPLFEAARVSAPGSRVVAVVRAGCANLVENNPHVDEIVVWDKHGGDRGIGGLMRMARRLKALDVATALIPHRSLRSALMAKLAGIPVRAGFNRGGGAFLHTRRVRYPSGVHEVKRNLLLAEAVGWKHEGFVPAIFPDDQDRMIAGDMLSGIGHFCVFAPGTVWPTKQWPPESYVAAGRMIANRGLTVVLSGGMDDRGVCRAIAAEIPGSLDFCGVLTLRQSAELYRRAGFVLTGDTAPQHIAAAMGARVYALFGPTVRDFGFWPYSERGTVIEEAVACRPCGIHGHQVCPKGHHLCMRRITPARVVEIIGQDLDESKVISGGV